MYCIYDGIFVSNLNFIIIITYRKELFKNPELSLFFSGIFQVFCDFDLKIVFFFQ